MKIFPSLIAGSLLNLEKNIVELEPWCDGFHIDIMDFACVENVTWGPPVVNALTQQTNKPLWIHLMVENPLLYIEKMALRPHDIVSVHYEYAPLDQLAAVFTVLRSLKLQASLAINPTTPIGRIEVFQEQIDHILLMSVQPGKSGQQFLPATLERIAELHNMMRTWRQPVPINIDGGITLSVIPPLKKLKIQDFAIGSALFNERDPVKNIKELTTLKN